MNASTPANPLCLLDPTEPPAFDIVNAGGAGTAVLVCDHASNRVPRRLGTLGLTPEQLADHIGWDRGAAEVARRLSAHLDAPLVLSGYSRLVIDCNRQLAHAGSVAQHSSGVPIPGNLGLDPAERDSRVASLFQPYHQAIARVLDARVHRPSVLLSIHSFTPSLLGQERPWPVGVSFLRDGRFAELMRRALIPRVEGLVGDNEPYPVEADVDYAIPVHGEGRGLPSVMIEIRNDGLAMPEGVEAWAARLAEAYREIEGEVIGL